MSSLPFSTFLRPTHSPSQRKKKEDSASKKSLIPVLSPTFKSKNSKAFPDAKTRLDNRYRVHLKVTKNGPTALECITAHTLRSILAGDYLHLVKSTRIIDCRFPYEYEGGHIKSAENLFKKQEILSLFHDVVVENTKITTNSKEIMVFYCEFSSRRGPTMLTYWNSLKDEFEAVHGRKFAFPRAYLLSGGYKNFFKCFPKACTPSNYVTMIDSRFMLDFYECYLQKKAEKDCLILQKNSKYLN